MYLQLRIEIKSLWYQIEIFIVTLFCILLTYIIAHLYIWCIITCKRILTFWDKSLFGKRYRTFSKRENVDQRPWRASFNQQHYYSYLMLYWYIVHVCTFLCVSIYVRIKRNFKMTIVWWESRKQCFYNMYWYTVAAWPASATRIEIQYKYIHIFTCICIKIK